MGREEGRIKQLSRQVIRLKKFIDQKPGDRRDQEGHNTEHNHRFSGRLQRLEVCFHTGKRHQKEEPQRAEGVDERHGVLFDRFRRSAENDQFVREMPHHIKTIRTDHHADDHECNDFRDLDPAEQQREERHAGKEYQK